MYWHSPPKASGLAATGGALLLTAGAVPLLLLLLLLSFLPLLLPRSAVAVVATFCAVLAEKSQQKKPHLQQLRANLVANRQQPQRQQSAAKNPRMINTGKLLLMTLIIQDMTSSVPSQNCPHFYVV
jgi:hypothetical protein|tara:strand:- start:1136 stop:1513 length:378 start_codon:yes stop_codon:yes gene_type:complete